MTPSLRVAFAAVFLGFVPVVAFAQAPEATAPPPPMPTLEPGRYWIRRPNRQFGITLSTPSARDGEAPEERTHGTTHCEPVDIVTYRRSLVWVFGSPRGGVAAEPPFDRQTVLSLRPESGALFLFALRTRIHDQPLRERCDAHVQITAEAAGHLETSAGVIFRHEAACDAAPPQNDRVCRAAACSFFPAETARPFSLGDECERGIDRLHRQQRFAEESSHASLEQTMARLRARAARGGAAWEYVPEITRCARSRWTRSSGGGTRIATTYRHAALTVRRQATYMLEPLFHRASRWAEEERRVDSSGGASELRSGGSTIGVDLVVLDGAVVLDDRWYFDTARRCNDAIETLMR